jgi:hypothetical protein
VLSNVTWQKQNQTDNFKYNFSSFQIHGFQQGKGGMKGCFYKNFEFTLANREQQSSLILERKTEVQH